MQTFKFVYPLLVRTLEFRRINDKTGWIKDQKLSFYDVSFMTISYFFKKQTVVSTVEIF